VIQQISSNAWLAGEQDTVKVVLQKTKRGVMVAEIITKEDVEQFEERLINQVPCKI
jgi:hypothetical protein